jgi:hypothetical protein
VWALSVRSQIRQASSEDCSLLAPSGAGERLRFGAGLGAGSGGAKRIAVGFERPITAEIAEPISAGLCCAPRAARGPKLEVPAAVRRTRSRFQSQELLPLTNAY